MQQRCLGKRENRQQRNNSAGGLRAAEKRRAPNSRLLREEGKAALPKCLRLIYRYSLSLSSQLFSLSSFFMLSLFSFCSLFSRFVSLARTRSCNSVLHGALFRVPICWLLLLPSAASPIINRATPELLVPQSGSRNSAPSVIGLQHRFHNLALPPRLWAIASPRGQTHRKLLNNAENPTLRLISRSFLNDWTKLDSTCVGLPPRRKKKERTSARRRLPSCELRVTHCHPRVENHPRLVTK